MAQSLAESMQWRKSVKMFDTKKKVSEEDVRDILEATRLSASSFGLQPWKMIVVSSDDVKLQLADAGYRQKQFTTASHVVVFATNTRLDDVYVEKYMRQIVKDRDVDRSTLNDYANAINTVLSQKSVEEIVEWSSRQVYIALGTLLAAAAVKEIDASPMEGFDIDVFDEILDLSERGLRAVVAVGIGYRTQDDTYLSIDKVRFPFEDVVDAI